MRVMLGRPVQQALRMGVRGYASLQVQRKAMVALRFVRFSLHFCASVLAEESCSGFSRFCGCYGVLVW